MAENSKIEWTDHTFNPWLGCTKISPACDHCYAESWAKRSGLVKWVPGEPRRRTSEATWKQPLRWNRKTERVFAAWEKFKTTNPGMTDAHLEALGFVKPRRPRVFCASLADVFDNAVPDQWRADLFDLIVATPNLDWLLLTKRIGNVNSMLPPDKRGSPNSWGCGYSNVWIGATVCNQAEADRDIPKLLAVPAAKRFLSIEPMLEKIDLGRALVNGLDLIRAGKTIDWIICGGEYGPHARPMHPDWVRSLRDQCVASGVHFFCTYRVGKKAAGRLLDGLTWDEVPT